MARKRMIDPSFWIDEKLGTLDVGARLLFMGLISQSDDEGRLNGHPALIRSLIFPYDFEITVENVDEWLSQLHERNLIVRYEVDSQKYIWIPNFLKHQTINRPQPSKLPEPFTDDSLNDHGISDDDASTDHAQKKGREEKGKEEKVKGREDNNATAPLTNPHLEILHNLCKECGITEENIFTLEQITSYIGAVDLEVIEAAIKKSSGKSMKYALGTLKGMVERDGIMKKEQLHQPKVSKFQRKSVKPTVITDNIPEGQVSDDEYEAILRDLGVG